MYLERSELTSIDMNPLMHPSVQHLLDMFATHLVLLNINPDDDEFNKELHKKVFKVKETKRWCPDGGVSEVCVVSPGNSTWWCSPDAWLDRKVLDTLLHSTVLSLLQLLFYAAPEQYAIMNGGGNTTVAWKISSTGRWEMQGLLDGGYGHGNVWRVVNRYGGRSAVNE